MQQELEDRRPGAERKRRGTNLPRVADYNELVLLDTIRSAPTGLSRSELTRTAGLSPQAVSDICRRLLDRELIFEAGKASAGLGKPRTLLNVNPAGGYAVGIHLDPAIVTYVLLDLSGQVVARISRRTADASDPDLVLHSISQAVSELITGAQIDTTRVAGIGIAAPGPIDPVRGVVVSPPLLPNWHNVLLRDHLRSTTGLPVLMDKDVIAAAVAERWAGVAAHAEHYVFVYVGTGIGVGPVVGGTVLRGSSGNAGDIGHLIVDPDGPLCTCGSRGCLGIAGAANTLVERGVEEGILAMAPPRNDPDAIYTGITALASVASVGDERATAILRHGATLLGRAVATQTNLFDSDMVVLGGPLWAPLAPFYLPVIEEYVLSHQLFGDVHGLTITSSGVDDVGAVGAACLVLDQSFSPHPASLVFD